jgi:hypothetical protein
MNSQVDPAIPASLVWSQFQLLETTFIGVTCSDVVNTTIKLPFGDIWECFYKPLMVILRVAYCWVYHFVVMNRSVLKQHPV